MEHADWATLASLPWIVTAPGTSNNEMRDELFRSHGVSVNATIEANNDLLMRTLIADGVGVGLVRADHADDGERNGRYTVSPLGCGHTKLLFVHPGDISAAKTSIRRTEGVDEAVPARKSDHLEFIVRGCGVESQRSGSGYPALPTVVRVGDVAVVCSPMSRFAEVAHRHVGQVVSPTDIDPTSRDLGHLDAVPLEGRQ